LIERIEKNISGNITIPDRQIVDFKEAIDFAFLGALRLQNLTNIKASVTGANSDSIAGCIYQP
jgi:anhydro-N-acetylmuramic acid kinase